MREAGVRVLTAVAFLVKMKKYGFWLSSKIITHEDLWKVILRLQ